MILEVLSNPNNFVILWFYISCVLATALSFMVGSASMPTRQSLQLTEPLLDLQMV